MCFRQNSEWAVIQCHLTARKYLVQILAGVFFALNLNNLSVHASVTSATVSHSPNTHTYTNTHTLGELVNLKLAIYPCMDVCIV